MNIEVVLTLLILWFLCGMLAYHWLKSGQEHETYWSDHELEWITTYRRPSTEMVRRRWCLALFGPIALLLLALMVVNEH